MLGNRGGRSGGLVELSLGPRTGFGRTSAIPHRSLFRVRHWGALVRSRGRPTRQAQSARARMQTYRTVTFEELRVRQGWDARRVHPPRDNIMALANELASNAMQGINESVRSVATRHDIDSGGFRARAKQYASIIEEIHRSEALNAADLCELIRPTMTTQQSGEFLPPFSVQSTAEPPSGDVGPTPISEALSAAVESGEVNDIDAAEAKLEALVLEGPPGKLPSPSEASSLEPAAAMIDPAAPMSSAPSTSGPMEPEAASKLLIGPAPSSWNDDDVQMSRIASDDPDALRDGGERKRREVVSDSAARVTVFWKTHSEGFSAFWSAAQEDQRGRLLLTVAPHMPNAPGSEWSSCGENVRGAMALLPELNLQDLAVHSDRLLTIFKRRAGTPPEDLYSEDLAVVRQSIRGGLLPGRSLDPEFTVYPASLQHHGGEPFKFRPGPDAAKHTQMLDSGILIGAWEFQPMLMRQEHILMTLTAIADEYCTEHLRTAKGPLNSAAAWLPPGCTAATSSELETVWLREWVMGRGLAHMRRDWPSAGLEHIGAQTLDSDDSLLAAVVSLKTRGNEFFGLKHFRAAARSYIEAADTVRLSRRTEADMTPVVKQLFATVLSNSAESSIKLASDPKVPIQERIHLLDRACHLCSSVLHSQAFSSIVPAKSSAKLEDRRRRALELRRELWKSMPHPPERAMYADVVKGEAVTTSQECPVCAEPWGGDLAAVLHCGHSICAPCLSKWHQSCVESQGTTKAKPWACPCCREALLPDIIEDMAYKVSATETRLTNLIPRLPQLDQAAQLQIV